MTMDDLLNGVSRLVLAFQDSIFVSFCLLITFAIALGIKRMVLE